MDEAGYSTARLRIAPDESIRRWRAKGDPPGRYSHMALISYKLIPKMLVLHRCDGPLRARRVTRRQGRTDTAQGGTVRDALYRRGQRVMAPLTTPLATGARSVGPDASMPRARRAKAQGVWSSTPSNTSWWKSMDPNRVNGHVTRNARPTTFVMGTKPRPGSA